MSVFARIFATFFLSNLLLLVPAHAVEPPSVNINTADVDTLVQHLKGVGPEKAKAIISYRETYGKFAAVEELAEVKGIGEATVEKNRSLIKL